MGHIYTKLSFLTYILKLEGFSAVGMCTGHPVFLYSAFAMGFYSLQAKINYYKFGKLFEIS